VNFNDTKTKKSSVNTSKESILETTKINNNKDKDNRKSSKIAIATSIRDLGNATKLLQNIQDLNISK